MASDSHIVFGKVERLRQRNLSASEEHSSSSQSSAESYKKGDIHYLDGSGTSGSSTGDAALNPASESVIASKVPAERTKIPCSQRTENPNRVVTGTSSSSSAPMPPRSQNQPSPGVAGSSSLGSVAAAHTDFSQVFFGRPPNVPGNAVQQMEDRHNSGKCTPCYFVYTRQKCKRGETCSFCHYPHKNPVKPSKSKRGQYKKLADELEEVSAENPEVFDETAMKLAETGGYLGAVVRSKLKRMGREDLAGSESGNPFISVKVGATAVKEAAEAAAREALLASGSVSSSAVGSGEVFRVAEKIEHAQAHKVRATAAEEAAKIAAREALLAVASVSSSAVGSGEVSRVAEKIKHAQTYKAAPLVDRQFSRNVRSEFKLTL